MNLREEGFPQCCEDFIWGNVDSLLTVASAVLAVMQFQKSQLSSDHLCLWKRDVLSTAQRCGLNSLHHVHKRTCLPAFLNRHTHMCAHMGLAKARNLEQDRSGFSS
jgi:hypothetical protein